MHNVVRAQELAVHVIQVAPRGFGEEKLALDISVFVPCPILLQLAGRGLANAKPVVFKRFLVVSDIRKPVFFLPLGNTIGLCQDTYSASASWVVQLGQAVSALVLKVSCGVLLITILLICMKGTYSRMPQSIR